MALDTLPTDLVVPTKQQVRDRWLADYVFRTPGANTGADTQPYVEASNVADMQMPVYDSAVKAARAAQIQNAVGSDLDAWGRRLGGDGEDNPLKRRGVTKSSGYVIVSVAAGGANINAGTELKDPRSGQKFTTSITAVYLDQQNVAIQSVAGGPVTNLAGGTKLQFTTPPPGVSSQAIVFTTSGGQGLTGGAPAEGDDDYRVRLLQATSEPPGSGNEAQLIQAVTAIPDLAVLAGFAYPAVFGPGTVAVAFLVPPAVLGGSRIPNAAQIAEVAGVLQSAFPSDDGIVVPFVSEQSLRVRLQVTWAASTPGWTDATPWPPVTSVPVHVVSATVSSAVITSTSSYPAPSSGQRIGFYDPVTSKFYKKTILSVTGGGPYTLAFDMTTLNASDPSFVPVVASVVSPWSDSLNSLVVPLLQYVDKQGPGEMYATFSDPGRRQRRFPAPTPDYFPSRVENRMIDGFLSFVEDISLYEPTAPFQVNVGTPGSIVYVFRLSDFGVFSQ